PGLLSRLDMPPSRVALLRASRIGDFICASPALRALRAALPQAEITMITLALLEDIVLRSPYIDHFVAFPGWPGLAEQFFDARKAARFFTEMQSERFDLAIQMQGSGVNSNPFTLMLGARITAGYIRPGDPPGRLDAALPLPRGGHEVRRVIDLMEFLGVPSMGEATEYPLWAQDHAAAEALLAGAPRPLVGIHPAARQRTRRWEASRFARAGRSLWERYGGTLVLIGEAGEYETARQVIAAAGAPALNLAGRSSLGVLGAVIARLSVLLTNDTGPAHIAYALKTPTVTIFGGGEIERYGPPQAGPFMILAHPVACRPCEVEDCPIGYECLEHVTVSQVVEAAAALIDGQRAF
ncbi:MAG: glycosyltransferase family 9 protein, partial [Chloroflexota bacterium]